ncbi:tRNA-uridine aminocarboxypropyltransferase [Marinomonas ostreistagni]|uniref:tRNA-uridine aminocarboxypropyltransferase n=1 Tax=Marinomonas ostreistagni TaxID=359209 RepID=A0ABS0ZFP6_9GAMM|nr:DTW domain-containing protein [Marinomonas ostreistagni]MBJ7552494.1 DTW domain-containing protein [Marinomonas ostreistagni]
MIQNPKRKHPPHCVDLLREQLEQISQRAFIARGSNTVRCPSCLMSELACFCSERKAMTSPITFTLLYHNTEIHKPTNSGRLLADLFPDQTKAYLWSRTEPEPALLERLNAFKDRTAILYPETEKRKISGNYLIADKAGDNLNHIILLDATWRLASKMLHQSRWLDEIPTYSISSDAIRSFKTRHAKHDHQFATAEVAAMCLESLNAKKEADALTKYYNIFNERSMSSRRR